MCQSVKIWMSKKQFLYHKPYFGFFLNSFLCFPFSFTSIIFHLNHFLFIRNYKSSLHTFKSSKSILHYLFHLSLFISFFFSLSNFLLIIIRFPKKNRHSLFCKSSNSWIEEDNWGNIIELCRFRVFDGRVLILLNCLWQFQFLEEINFPLYHYSFSR